MKNTCFVIKTSLDTDGRVLNQIKILRDRFPDLTINIIILEDQPTTIDLGDKIRLHPIKMMVRNSKLLRLFTVLEFSTKSLIKLLKLKPEVIHCQDSAVSLPIVLYRWISRSKTYFIYDDHEVPNENSRGITKVYQKIESHLIRRAELVISANKERTIYLKNRYRLPDARLSYFINLPYYEKHVVLSQSEKKLIEEIKLLKENGINLIMHQGSIHKERGREILAALSKNLDSESKILLLGISRQKYNDFIKEYDLNEINFHFIGMVNYYSLSEFWKYANSTFIMYLPTYRNNRLCAPNRFYIALKQRIPIYVNKDNPVLYDLVNKYQCGGFVEDILAGRYSCLKKSCFYSGDGAKYNYLELRQNQVDTFAENYKKAFE